MYDITPAISADYKMIKSAKIRNFRCFQSADLVDCRRINLVVGDNGAGKTSLLEALFLASAASPEIALRYRQWRGMEGFATTAANNVGDALWSDLFYDFDLKNAILIEMEGTSPHDRNFMASQQSPHISIPLNDPQFQGPNANESSVVFRWKSSSMPAIEVKPFILNGALQINSNGPPVKIDSYFFPSSHVVSGFESAMRFSELNQTFRQDQIVSAIKRDFPIVRDITNEIFHGSASLGIEVKGLSRRVPVGYISSGINKIIGILCSIARQEGGALFVDEIENGIHYAKMPGLWRSIRDLAQQNKAQIFASTHSLECIEAAEKVAKEFPDDFGIIQIGSGKVQQFGAGDLSFALREKIEIRT